MLKIAKSIDLWITIILLSLLLFHVSIKKNPLYMPLYIVTTNSQDVVSSILTSTSMFFKSYSEVSRMKRDNEQLQMELMAYKINHEFSQYIYTELESLKESFSIKKNYLSLTLVPIKQIQNESTQHKNIIIAKNITNEKLKADQGVITTDGVVGIISNVSDDVITILPITSSKSSIPVWVGEDKIFAFISGNNSQDEMILKLKYLEDSQNIEVGNKIVTNGFDEIFPEGIYIGTVKKIIPQKNSLFLTVIVSYPHHIYTNKFLYVIKN
ncbi:rod shape-determining protein MreC [bacterium]|nr:rod shape-determining protein MreC [bacterium]